MAGGGGGGGGGGSGGGGGGATMAVYAQIVNKVVKANWRFPQMAAKEHLTATVELQIDKTGRIPCDTICYAPPGSPVTTPRP